MWGWPIAAAPGVRVLLGFSVACFRPKMNQVSLFLAKKNSFIIVSNVFYRKCVRMAVQFDASRRWQKELKSSGGKNGRHEPYWGGGGRACYVTLDLWVTTTRRRESENKGQGNKWVETTTTTTVKPSFPFKVKSEIWCRQHCSRYKEKIDTKSVAHFATHQEISPTTRYHVLFTSNKEKNRILPCRSIWRIATWNLNLVFEPHAYTNGKTAFFVSLFSTSCGRFSIFRIVLS